MIYDGAYENGLAGGHASTPSMTWAPIAHDAERFGRRHPGHSGT